MKKSSFFLFGMLAVLLAFGMVLAGCEGPAGPAGANGKDGYPGVVTLAKGSSGARSDESITVTNGQYAVKVGAKWHAVVSGGELSATGYSTVDAMLTAETGNLATNPGKIVNLDNRKTYDVYLFIAPAAGSGVATITGNTIADMSSATTAADGIEFTSATTASTVFVKLKGSIASNTMASPIVDTNTIVTDTKTYEFGSGSSYTGFNCNATNGQEWVTFTNITAGTPIFKLLIN